MDSKSRILLTSNYFQGVNCVLWTLLIINPVKSTWQQALGYSSGVHLNQISDYFWIRFLIIVVQSLLWVFPRNMSQQYPFRHNHTFNFGQFVDMLVIKLKFVHAEMKFKPGHYFIFPTTGKTLDQQRNPDIICSLNWVGVSTLYLLPFWFLTFNLTFIPNLKALRTSCCCVWSF